MTDTNLTATTRELWERTAEKQINYKVVLVAALMDRHQVKYKGGTSYKVTTDFEDLESLVVEHGDNTPLPGGSKTVFRTAQWYPKGMECPVVIPASQMLSNKGEDTRIVPLEQSLVEKGQQALVQRLNRAIWRTGSASRDTDVNSNAEWQGVPDALTHDLQYGGLERTISTTTNTFWQGASLAGTFADYNTAITATIYNFRRDIDAVMAFCDDKKQLMAFTSNTIFRSLQSQVQGQVWYKPEGTMTRYGFTAMTIDDVEVVAEPWLTSSRNSAASTDVLKFAMLNLKYWRLMIDPERPLSNFTGFTHQAEIANGTDQYLGRAMTRGNLICIHPNANIYHSNMS